MYAEQFLYQRKRDKKNLANVRFYEHLKLFFNVMPLSARHCVGSKLKP